MGLETGTYIDDLNASNPVHATDPVSQGDDHVRLIKSVLLNTFPNLDGPVDITPTEVNYLDGVTGVTGTGKLALHIAPTFSGLVTAGSFTGTLDAADMTTGLLPDARIQAAGVTQHQAALGITESQISDLGSYIESGDDVAELTVTELKIDADDCSITRDGAGQIAVEGSAVMTHEDATLTSAKLHLSSSAPSGGSDGDVWLEHEA